MHLNPTLTLKDVLYIPTSHYTLLYIAKLGRTSNIIFQFYLNQCLLQDQGTKQIVVVAKLLHNLYLLDVSSFPLVTPTNPSLSVCNNAKTLCLSVSNNANVKVASLFWHQRLGHASYYTLLHLPMCKTFPLHSSLCHVCPLAKESRLPFPPSIIHTTYCFELLHMDVWGPYKIPALTGARFFLTMIDDFSRATWTFLHHKSDVPRIFSIFFIWFKLNFTFLLKPFIVIMVVSFLANNFSLFSILMAFFINEVAFLLPNKTV